MPITQTTEICKVGRKIYTYVRIHEPAADDKERKIADLFI